MFEFYLAVLIARAMSFRYWGLLMTILGVGFVIMMVSFANPELFYPKHLPKAIIERAPVEVLDEVMKSFESQGYLVKKTKNLKTDPNMRNQVLISYEVKSYDGKDVYEYTWAWKAPYDAMFRPTMKAMELMLKKCELIPKSEPAKSLNDYVNKALAERGYNDMPTIYNVKLEDLINNWSE